MNFAYWDSHLALPPLCISEFNFLFPVAPLSIHAKINRSELRNIADFLAPEEMVKPPPKDLGHIRDWLCSTPISHNFGLFHTCLWCISFATVHVSYYGSECLATLLWVGKVGHQWAHLQSNELLQLLKGSELIFKIMSIFPFTYFFHKCQNMKMSNIKMKYICGIHVYFLSNVKNHRHVYFRKHTLLKIPSLYWGQSKKGCLHSQPEFDPWHPMCSSEHCQ